MFLIKRANKTTKTSTRFSKIEEHLGVTNKLKLAEGYTILGGLVLRIGILKLLRSYITRKLITLKDACLGSNLKQSIRL